MIQLTIKRESGQTEIVDSNFAAMNSILFGKIQVATKQAGKGDVISWDTVDSRTEEKKSEESKLKAAGWCDKCQTFCYGDCNK